MPPLIKTTAFVFSELGFINFPVPKAKLGDLILNTYKVAGQVITVETLDKLKERLQNALDSKGLL